MKKTDALGWGVPLNTTKDTGYRDLRLQTDRSFYFVLYTAVSYIFQNLNSGVVLMDLSKIRAMGLEPLFSSEYTAQMRTYFNNYPTNTDQVSVDGEVPGFSLDTSSRC